MVDGPSSTAGSIIGTLVGASLESKVSAGLHEMRKMMVKQQIMDKIPNRSMFRFLISSENTDNSVAFYHLDEYIMEKVPAEVEPD